MKYYKIENGVLEEAGNLIKIKGRGWLSNPNEKTLNKNGYFPLDEASFTPPTADEGYTAVLDDYEVVEGKWTKKWRVEAITYTYDDYNRALEDYLYSVRAERGYDEREPSPYYDKSIVPRWRADAADFCEFRDRCMLYALPILNEYKATGNAPSLADFKAGFPKMTWTYQEEGAE